jgi:hypothetical protein
MFKCGFVRSNLFFAMGNGLLSYSPRIFATMFLAMFSGTSA